MPTMSTPDSPALVQAAIDRYIEKLVDEAPPLTANQRSRLAELLKPVRVTP